MLGDLDDVRYETEDGVATITLDRPEVLNALRTQTYQELLAAVTTAADDGEVGVIVLTGAGDRAFSSGGDVRQQHSRTPQAGRRHIRIELALAAELRNCGKPTLAAVNGYAIGAGNELQLMCDLTVASDRAIFGQVGPRVGSVPIWGGTQYLPRLVGEKRAREILFLCRRYSAEEARAMGWINFVVPHDELAAETRKVCDEILDKSPQSLRIAKTSLNYESDQLWSSFTHGMEMLSLTMGNDENMEGVRAFLEKRDPDYRKFRQNEQDPEPSA